MLDEPVQGADIPIESDIAPGFETLPDELEDGDPIGPDDWYDVDELDDAPPSDAELATIERSSAFDAWDNTRNRILGAIAMLLLLLAGIGAMIWRRRRREAVVQSAPSTGLASGIRKSMESQMPSVLQDPPDWARDEPAKTEEKAEPEAVPEVEEETTLDEAVEEDVDPAAHAEPEPEPEPEAQSEPEPEAEASEPVEPAPVAPAVAASEPARIDLDLAIESATRSFMMFTVEFSLEVANRSDHAVRELTLAAKLGSAQRGGTNAAPIAGGQPIAQIQRLGPQQSQRITGTLQLPLSEVTPIRQGTKPLLIPLLHITLEGNGQSAMNRTFVLGTPSQAGTGRVHPLPLDAPPGSLPPLRAQAIKQSGEDDAKSTETV